MTAPASALRRAVFLDRDGVLIRNHVRDGLPYAITAGDEVEIIEGVPEACAALRALGWLLVMVTNQPDAANGRTPREFIEGTNARLVRELQLDDIRVCWHDDRAGCDCRKPKPGMLLAAARELGIDLAASIAVGDRWRDIGAGNAAGCRTVLVDYGYRNQPASAPHHTAKSLRDAMPWIRAQ